MFIPPRYVCDCCHTDEEAEWTGLPHWDIPLRWSEVYIAGKDKHFCIDCSRSCECGQCGGLPSWECMENKDRK